MDKYINETKPWALAKDPEQKERLAQVLNTGVQCLWNLGVCSHSFLPEASLKLLKTLRPDFSSPVKWLHTKEEVPGGQLIGEIPRLFPRIEEPKE